MSCYDDHCLGHFCHWCGERVDSKVPAKTGNHLFGDHTKCKQAHYRAYIRYLKRAVPVAPGGLAGPASSSMLESNADDAPCRSASSGGTRKSRLSKSNRRKGAKRA